MAANASTSSPASVPGETGGTLAMPGRVDAMEPAPCRGPKRPRCGVDASVQTESDAVFAAGGLTYEHFAYGRVNHSGTSGLRPPPSGRAEASSGHPAQPPLPELTACASFT